MSILQGNDIVAADFIVTVVAGEALTANDSVYIKASDGKAYKTDADADTTIGFIGFAISTVALGASVNIMHHGQMTGFSALTIGALYYVSGTPGAITATAPTSPKIVGTALSATIIKIAEFSSVRVTTFTANGTWTKMPGLKYVRVRNQAAGGGGGGCTTASRCSSGGAGGGYSEKIIPAATLGATETVTVGTGGTAGVGTGGTGGTGGTSSFGAHLSATGGTGGAVFPAEGGTGGVGSSGTTNSAGSGGGGSHSGADLNPSGIGGSSVLGGGGLCARGTTGDVAGHAGGAYGGGGSGAFCGSGGGADTVGGAGADGIVIVEEFY